MGWFESRSQKEKLSTIKNLFAVMMADGKITEEEKEFLALICQRMEVSKKDLQKIIESPEKVEFTPARDEEARVRQLMDAVYMMLIDGEINDEEFDFCVELAVRLGFPAGTVRNIINAVVESIEQQSSESEVRVAINEFLVD